MATPCVDGPACAMKREREEMQKRGYQATVLANRQIQGWLMAPGPGYHF